MKAEAFAIEIRMTSDAATGQARPTVRGRGRRRDRRRRQRSQGRLAGQGDEAHQASGSRRSSRRATDSRKDAAQIKALKQALGDLEKAKAKTIVLK